MKHLFIVMGLGVTFSGVDAAELSAKLNPCIKMDLNKDQPDPNDGVPGTFFNDNELQIDLSGTAMESIFTTQSESERVMTAHCQGSVTLKFPERYKLQSFEFAGAGAFISGTRSDDFIRILVKGSVSSEEGKDGFESKWPNPLRQRDFTGDGDFSFKHREQTTVCGRKLTMQIDKAEVVVSRPANEGDRSTSINPTNIKFKFVRCNN